MQYKFQLPHTRTQKRTKVNRCLIIAILIAFCRASTPRIIKRQFDVCQGVYETNLSADWINPLINETHSILTRFEPSLKIMLDG